jgi:hypothetical protein
MYRLYTNCSAQSSINSNYERCLWKNLEETVCRVVRDVGSYGRNEEKSAFCAGHVPHLYHRNLVPAAKSCWIFMKYGIGVLYINVSNKHKFHENHGSESYISLSGVKEFLPVVPNQFWSNSVQMTFT